MVTGREGLIHRPLERCQLRGSGCMYPTRPLRYALPSDTLAGGIQSRVFISLNESPAPLRTDTIAPVYEDALPR